MADIEHTVPTYDTLLTCVGDMGIYQWRLLALSVVSITTQSLHLLSTVFTMGQPDFRCAIDGFSNDSYTPYDQFHADMIKANIPFISDEDRFSECYRYKQPQPRPQSTDQWSNISTTEQERCSSWVYSKDVFSSSIISEFNLVCDRQLYVSHINMVGMLGIMMFSLVCGPLSDRFGRKKAFLFFYWVHMIFAVLSAFVTSLPPLLVSRFVIAGSGIALYASNFVLCMEIVGPRWRVIASASLSCGWILGMLVLVTAAYFLRDWRVLQHVTSYPMIAVAVSYIWLLPESPRWLINKGHLEEAREILRDIARVNKREIPEQLLNLSASDLIVKPQKRPEDLTIETVSSSTTPVVQLIKSPTMVARVAILCLDWIVSSLIYYGISLNIGSVIGGNIYLMFFILTVLEIISRVLVYGFLDRIGRKVFFCAMVLLGGGACLGTVVPVALGSGSKWPNVVLSNLGKFGITGAFIIIWIFTSELMPTSLRQSGVGFCSFVGRIGAVVSPYIARLDTLVTGQLGKALPLVVFGSLAVVAGVLSLLLPETVNRKLPETVKEAENITVLKSKKKSSHDTEVEENRATSLA